VKAQSRVDLAELPLLGGALCLDLVNTVDPRHQPPILEYLHSYDALLDWAVYAGALTPPQAQRLADLGGRQPAKAARVHARAIRLREALYQLFAPTTRTQHPKAPLAVLNTELQHAMTAATLEPAPGGYHLAWARGDQFDRMLWPVVRSAAELLSSPALERVGECHGQGCGWLFVDTSKAGRRRWCRMAICGNRAKARRHSQRARTSPSLTAPASGTHARARSSA
jgi:predicted RNA-binding Zn ribbon-like protein